MNKSILNLSVAVLFAASCAPQYGPVGGSVNPGDGGYGVKQSPSISKSDIGTVAGALGGGFLGSNVGKGKGKTVGTIAGTLLGGYLGNQIGSTLDRADMSYYDRTSQSALETTATGTTSRWINPDSGNSGAVTPTRTFQTNSGQFCREFSQSIVVAGQKEEAFGTACRQADGSWKIVN